MTGSRARPHCLAEATATRCHRSCACARPSAARPRSDTLGHHRHDARDAGHRGVTHDAVHLVPLEHGLHEDGGHGRLGTGNDRIADRHRHALAIGSNHARVELMAVAIEHGNRIAGGQPHDANEVMRLVFGKARFAPRRVETRHVEARTRHEVRF